MLLFAIADRAVGRESLERRHPLACGPDRQSAVLRAVRGRAWDLGIGVGIRRVEEPQFEARVEHATCTTTV